MRARLTVARGLDMYLRVGAPTLRGMESEQSTVEKRLLSEAERQTQLLGQINLLLWVFAGVALFGVVLLLATSGIF